MLRRYWGVNEAGLLGVPDQLVLRQELVEFFYCEIVLRSIEPHHIEDLFLAVIEVNGSGVWLPGNHLQQQDSLGHLDPSRRHALTDFEEFADDSVCERFAVADGKLAERKQTSEVDCSSA